jgi:hypothetical protein
LGGDPLNIPNENWDASKLKSALIILSEDTLKALLKIVPVSKLRGGEGSSKPAG